MNRFSYYVCMYVCCFSFEKRPFSLCRNVEQWKNVIKNKKFFLCWLAKESTAKRILVSLYFNMFWPQKLDLCFTEKNRAEKKFYIGKFQKYFSSGVLLGSRMKKNWTNKKKKVGIVNEFMTLANTYFQTLFVLFVHCVS